VVPTKPSGCVQNELKRVGVKKNYQGCIRVKSTADGYSNRAQDMSMNLNRCLNLAKLEPRCIHILAYNTVNRMCYLYDCEGDSSRITAVSTDQHKNWVLYSTFGKVPQDPFP
jgi:hypothetical protein